MLNRRLCGIAAIILFLALLYLLTMPTQYLIGDEENEIRSAASGAWYLRSRHLLTTPFYQSVLRVNPLLGIRAESFIVVQIANILFGLACAVFLYATLRLLKVPHGLALAFTALAGVSFGMWEHSFCPDVSIHPQLFHVISIYFLVKYLTAPARSKWTLVTALAAGCASALFASYYAMFVPLMMLIVLWDWKKRRGIPLVRLLLIFGLVAALVGVVPFVAAAWAHGHWSPSGFVTYMTSVPRYTARYQPILKSFGPERWTRSVAGAVRVFCGVTKGLIAVKLIMRGAPLRGVTSWDFAELGFGLLLLLSIGWLCIKGTFSGMNRRVAVFCWAGLLGLYAFGTYLMGSDQLGWVPGVPFFVILAAAGSKSLVNTPRKARVYYGLLGLALTVTLMINMSPRPVPSILFPEGSRESKAALINARQFADRLTPRDLVLYVGRGWVGSLWRVKEAHRRKTNMINLVWNRPLDDVGRGDKFCAHLDKRIEDTLGAGGKAYIEGITGPKMAEQHGPWQEFGSVRGISRENWRAHLDRKFELRHLADSPSESMTAIVGVKKHAGNGK